MTAFIKVQSIFTAPRSIVYRFTGAFYQEPRDSLDAVIIGASQAYDSWAAPYAFSRHGMAVWAFCCPRLPAQALIYYAEEVRRTQPHALLIVNLNILDNILVNDTNIHWSTNHLPPSINKYKMILNLIKEAGYNPLQHLDLLFPILKFHERWSTFTSFDFQRQTNGLKSAMATPDFFTKRVNLSGEYPTFSKSASLDSKREAIISELLDYCDEKHIEPLFISVPQSLSGKKGFGAKLNTIEAIIRERGYQCLDLLNLIEDTGVRPETDFSDHTHLNLHGSLKMTAYLSRYLAENYGFADKRGQPGYESWDQSVELYFNRIKTYALPFETAYESRNYDLSAPALSKPVVKDQTVRVSWSASEGTDLYEIYRKSAAEDETGWMFIASVNGDTLQYTDSGLRPETKYTYTVVPVGMEDGQKQYGNFSFSGVAASTKPLSPEPEPAAGVPMTGPEVSEEGSSE